MSAKRQFSRTRGMKIKRPIALINGTIVTPFRVAENEFIVVENGKIAQMGKRDSVALPRGADVIDATGKIITPGFVDLHMHGSCGHFFNEADQKAIDEIIDFNISHGTTCLLATLYIDERRRFIKKIGDIARYIKQKRRWGVLNGIHLEGPFINKKMKGALNEHFIQDATVDAWLALKKAGQGEIKQMTIAPEIKGMPDIMRLAVQDGIVLAVAHSEAKYEDIEVAIDNGLSQVTHIFNAMHPMHHRDPGVVAAALLKRELKVHLIADGTHVHPAMIDLLYRLKGASGIILISDAISAAGKEDGLYSMAGKEVIVKNGMAYLLDGTLAGSTVTMEKAVATMVRKARIPLDEAVRMGSLNPARVLGIDHEKGILAAGKDADMVVMNDNFDVEMTIIGGTIVYKKDGMI
jgi:N-acetylglucosamine-6-phosphate deacetylase